MEETTTVTPFVGFQSEAMDDAARSWNSLLRSPGSNGGGISVAGITIISRLPRDTRSLCRNIRASMKYVTSQLPATAQVEDLMTRIEGGNS